MYNTIKGRAVKYNTSNIAMNIIPQYSNEYNTTNIAMNIIPQI